VIFPNTRRFSLWFVSLSSVRFVAPGMLYSLHRRFPPYIILIIQHPCNARSVILLPPRLLNTTKRHLTLIPIHILYHLDSARTTFACCTFPPFNTYPHEPTPPIIWPLFCSLFLTPTINLTTACHPAITLIHPLTRSLVPSAFRPLDISVVL